MHPQLSAIAQGLDAARGRLRSLHATVPADVWTHRPAPDRWSAAQCIAHLNLTSEAIVPLLQDALAEARARKERFVSRYRRNLAGWMAWRLVTPAGGLKTATPSPFVPSVTPPVECLLADFERLQSQMLACVQSADGLPLDRVTVVSPFHGRLRYNLYAAMTLVPRHQHRHLLQAERTAGARLVPVSLVSAAV